MGRAAELREQALAKLIEAKGLAEPDGSVAAENHDRLEGLMAEFAQLDEQAKKAQTAEDQVGTAADRMAWYTGKATGTEMRFNKTVLDPNRPTSLGDQFTQSAEYQRLIESGALTSDRSSFRSDPVMAAPHLRIGAAASDIVQTESGGPANALVLPDYRPGIIPLAQRPLTVRELFSQDTTTSDSISYAQQTGFDNAASAVAQSTSVNGSGAAGGVKPQSSIAWQRKTSPVETIATWMAVTRQALADVGQVRGLINNQGRLMLQLEEEDQLLTGNGDSPNLSGLYDQDTLQTLNLTGADNLDGIRTARRLVRTGASRLAADAIVINPIDSEEFDLMKDLEGRYRGGNPIGNFAFNQPIWSLRRVESEAVSAGKAIVGAFRAGATVLERQPITVLTADQHADFFVRNLVVILFEERLGFPVYFPTAFVDITLDGWDS